MSVVYRAVLFYGCPLPDVDLDIDDMEDILKEHNIPVEIRWIGNAYDTEHNGRYALEWLVAHMIEEEYSKPIRLNLETKREWHAALMRAQSIILSRQSIPMLPTLEEPDWYMCQTIA